jgi:ribosome recycling factor
MTYNFKRLEKKIADILAAFTEEISSLRTGRASPSLVENIKIEAYETINPLKNLASITLDDPKTLIVQPWDKSLVDTIQKAIEASSLGIKSAAVKDFIRIVLPPLTEERRITLVKLLKEKLEEARISIRKARDETWKDIQEKERGKEISEDDKFRLKDQMEDKIKKGTEKLEEAYRKKEKEIKE